MIADFRFDDNPSVEAISVRLFWAEGEQMGEVRVPPAVRDALCDAQAPSPGSLPIFSALAYAIFVAGFAQRRLAVTGDRSVWSEHWGRLVETQ